MDAAVALAAGGLPPCCWERRATMTFTALTRRFRGTVGRPPREREPLIGVTADRTFACPGCARPLLFGQGRCLGCGSLLVAGVLVRTALFLVLVGSVVGMIGGAVIAGVAMGPRLAAADAARVAAAAAPVPATPALVPVASIGADAPAGGGAAAGATLPAGVTAGLLQVAAVNDRLARSGTALSTLLANRGSGAGEIGLVLRKIAADARSGDQAARRLASWSPAGSLVADGTALYRSVASVATDSLAAPLSDDAAYIAAGGRMLKALAPLAAIDAATLATAEAAGIALPEATPTP
jgi:hypothetical protein